MNRVAAGAAVLERALPHQARGRPDAGQQLKLQWGRVVALPTPLELMLLVLVLLLRQHYRGGAGLQPQRCVVPSGIRHGVSACYHGRGVKPAAAAAATSVAVVIKE